MAGGVLLPIDPWPRFSVTEEKLEALVEAGLLCLLSGRGPAEWKVPGDEDEPAPPPEYVVSFTLFHEFGFGVPVLKVYKSYF